MDQDLQSLLVPIQHRLRAIWKRITLIRCLQGVTVAVGILATALLLLVALEAFFWVELSWRTALLLIWATAAACLTGILVLLPFLAGWRGRAQYKQMAKLVATKVPEAEDRLVNVLELGQGEASSAPVPLVSNAVKKLGDEITLLPLEAAVSYRRSWQLARLAVLPVAGLLIFLLAAPHAFLGASHRLFSPGVTFTRPVPYSVNVKPGSTAITRGDSLLITAQVQGSELPRELTLEILRAGERNVREVTLLPVNPDAFVHLESNVRQDFKYRLSSASLVTAWFDVRVLDRPILRNLTVDLYPPTYTGLTRQSLAPGTGNITALRGTRASISVRSNMSDLVARLVFEGGGSEIPMPDLTGSFTVVEPDRYHIHLETDSGITNSDPVEFTVTPVDDRYPSVRIVAPDPESVLDVSLDVPLAARLEDDFGFSRLSLYWRLAESRYDEAMQEFESFDLDIPSDRVLQYIWPVNATTGLDVIPGDVVEYYLRVWDNDGWQGPKTASSATHRIRLPSLAEQYDQLETLQDGTQSELETLLDDAEGLREQFDELREELRRKQDADWDDQQQLEDVSTAQQELESRVEALNEAMDEAAQQMEENGLVSEELLEVFRDLQEVTDEINAPELMEALQELQEAIAELNPEKLQESLEKYAFNEEQFQERLERTLELFRNFQVQQKLDEAAARAEDLKEVQDESVGQD